MGPFIRHFLLLFSILNIHTFINAKADPDPAMHATFWNFEKFEVSLWWEDHKGGVHQGDIGPERKIDINTYIGHKFFFTPKTNRKNRLHDMVMEKFQPQYFLYSEQRRKEMTDAKQAERQKF